MIKYLCYAYTRSVPYKNKKKPSIQYRKETFFKVDLVFALYHTSPLLASVAHSSRIISRFLQCKGRLASCSRSLAVFLIAVKNAAGAAALARACVAAYLRSGNLTQLLLPLHTFAFLNRPEVYPPFAGQRCAVYAALCFYRSLARGVFTILKERERFLFPLLPILLVCTYDCIDADD